MILNEIYNVIEEEKPNICRNMEGTCDECPFGVWNNSDYGYECNILIFKEQLKKYIEQDEEILRRDFIMHM